MNKLYLTLFFTLVISASSWAQEIQVCGALTQLIAGPKCLAGQLCPHFMQTVTKINGTRVWGTTDQISEQMNELMGQNVCARGAFSGGGLEVDSISAEDQQ